MISNKKVLTAILSIFIFLGNQEAIFAQEQEQEAGFSYQLGVSLSMSPVLELKPDDGSGKNNFAAIKGINVPIPYAQFVTIYTKPLDFGDSLFFSGANIAFVAGPTLTPITLDTQAGIIFTPLPILNFGLGATAGTGWAIGDSHGIGLYNSDAEKFEQSVPFTVWHYSFIFQTNFQFDFGAIFPGEWTHIVITANEQLYYEANSAANKYELWEWTAGKDYVNGFVQSGNVMLGYMFPEKTFRLIGMSLAWQGHLKGCDYGIYEKNYDGDFLNLFLALQTMFYINDKNQLAVGTSLSSQRAFLEPTSTFATGSNIKNTTSGREWCFSGLIVQCVFSF